MSEKPNRKDFDKQIEELNKEHKYWEKEIVETIKTQEKIREVLQDLNRKLFNKEILNTVEYVELKKKLEGEKEVSGKSASQLSNEHVHYAGSADSKPSELCTLEEQDQCYSFHTILCLNDKISTCMYGKKRLEKHPLDKGAEGMHIEINEVAKNQFEELMKDAKELRIEDLGVIQRFISHEHMLVEQCKKDKQQLINNFIKKIDYYLKTDDCEPIEYFIKLKEELQKELK